MSLLSWHRLASGNGRISNIPVPRNGDVSAYQPACVRRDSRTGLTSCRHDENQTASHAYIFEEVNQLDRITRCTNGQPEFMRHEGRWYQLQAGSCNGGALLR